MRQVAQSSKSHGILVRCSNDLLNELKTFQRKRKFSGNAAINYILRHYFALPFDVVQKK